MHVVHVDVVYIVETVRFQTVRVPIAFLGAPVEVTSFDFLYQVL
jgi:hypothetical protein